MKILIATDGSEFSKAAVESACKYIQPNNTEIKCLSIYEDPMTITLDPLYFSSQYYEGMVESLREAAEAYVRDAKVEIRKHFSEDEVVVNTEVKVGFADRVIVEIAEDWQADLIVVGSHGRGFWGRMLGSVSNGVVHHAPCSVLVVKTKS